MQHICLPYRVGIMSLKSSPGGQSFSFNTIGFPSASCSRSAFKQHIISHLWHQSENDTTHQSLLTWLKKKEKIVWVLTWNDLEAIPEVSHLHIRDNSTVSAVDQIYILVTKLLTEGIGLPQMTFEAFIYSRDQHRLDTNQRKQQRSQYQECLWTALVNASRFLLVPVSSILWRSSSCCCCLDPVGRVVFRRKARSVTYVAPKH